MLSGFYKSNYIIKKKEFSFNDYIIITILYLISIFLFYI